MFSDVTLLPVAVAVFVPVADVPVSASDAVSIAASDTAATDVPASACSVSLASGVNAVRTPLVRLRIAWNVSSRQFGVTGVIDDARTEGAVTPVLSSVVGVTSSGVVLSAPWIAVRLAANRPEVKLMVGAVSPDCITRRNTAVWPLVGVLPTAETNCGTGFAHPPGVVIDPTAAVSSQPM
jgi:hypothetical protein